MDTMKTPTESLPIIHNLPEGLTLADLHLENVKTGDEIVTLSREEKTGALSVGSRVFRVCRASSNEDWRVFARNDEGQSRGSWLVKNGGGCPYAMHPQNIMRFYYSANPEHVAQARRNAREIKAAEEARKAAFEAQMTLARPLGDELGDGWDREECYRRETAAQTLAEKLTPEQMRTLAGWLGVKMG